MTAPASTLRRPRPVVAEMLKILTVNTWWILSLCFGLVLALALTSNIVQAYFELTNAQHAVNIDGLEPADAQRVLLDHDLARVLKTVAANIFTSGQYGGLLVTMVLGILVVTNEFSQQTATATFLAIPARTRVVVSKIIAVAVMAVGLWLVTTLIDLAVGAAYLGDQGYATQLGAWPVERAILLNLLAYVLWSFIGVGFGLLIRNQTGAVLTGAGLYLIGTLIGQAIVFLLFAAIKETWVFQLQVLIPTVASSYMVAGDSSLLNAPTDVGLISQPAWWVAGLVLVGWGVVSAAIGTIVTLSRDIS